MRIEASRASFSRSVFFSETYIEEIDKLRYQAALLRHELTYAAELPGGRKVTERIAACLEPALKGIVDRCRPALRFIRPVQAGEGHGGTRCGRRLSGIVYIW